MCAAANLCCTNGQRCWCPRYTVPSSHYQTECLESGRHAEENMIMTGKLLAAAEALDVNPAIALAIVQASLSVADDLGGFDVQLPNDVKED